MLLAIFRDPVVIYYMEMEVCKWNIKLHQLLSRRAEHGNTFYIHAVWWEQNHSFRSFYSISDNAAEFLFFQVPAGQLDSLHRPFQICLQSRKLSCWLEPCLRFWIENGYTTDPQNRVSGDLNTFPSLQWKRDERSSVVSTTLIHSHESQVRRKYARNAQPTLVHNYAESFNKRGPSGVDDESLPISEEGEIECK